MNEIPGIAQSSPTYNAACKAEYQPLAVELTHDVFVTILLEKYLECID